MRPGFKTIITFLMAAVALTGRATDLRTLAVKADRFYHYEEWASALAMYQLMLEQQPRDPDIYSHAIVAAALDNNPGEQMRLMRYSMDSLVPVDSVFNGVMRCSFEQGNALIYEDFLERVSESMPWMKRNIDSRLLSYYSWRRNGGGMIKYALRMLDGMPDNIDYLTTLADGYFTLGRQRCALDTYRQIIALDPENYHALLVLGNYFADQVAADRFDDPSRALAEQYLTRASRLHSTPYTTSRIEALSNTLKKN